MKKVFTRLFSALLIAIMSSVAVCDETYTSSTGILDVDGGYFQLAQYGGYKASNYIDVQSRTSSFAYWGLLRWDLTDVKEKINNNLGGAGNWEVTKVELTVYTTQYGYSASGNVDVRFTTDDKTDYTTLVNATDGYSDPIGDQLDGLDPNGMPNTDGVFLNTVYYNNDVPKYSPVTYVLFDKTSSNTNPGQIMLAKDIVIDDTCTLCFVDNKNDYSVSAAWAGPTSSYNNERPVLTITAKAAGHVAICVDRPSCDFDNDCKVTLSDFAMFCQEWLSCGYADPADCK